MESARNKEKKISYEQNPLRVLVKGLPEASLKFHPQIQYFTMSLARTWPVSGVGLSRNTIEASWQVYPQIYGDNNPRLFVYWTNDGYQKTGCYNLCKGFIQTNKQYTIGGSYSNIRRSSDHNTGNWWLKINDNDIMRYWPRSLFNILGDGATDVQWGGEIYAQTSARHTITDMGSGRFADEGYKKSSYIKNLMIGNCYSVKTGISGTNFGSHFFYGGPGQNVKCP
ncbi:unnamed protein product [Arabis nemorensis]|uniref:Neprosin PEP catalytic domain-containing protein n=1 Tax=Arabis nemorensis TaxID=586526 RepID=A0A565BFL5_9BRAS|nr:unnamed protein product [Arabis nemorensis]